MAQCQFFGSAFSGSQLSGSQGRLVRWDVDLVVSGNLGHSAGRRAFDFCLASRMTRLHLLDHQNWKKLPRVIPTDCGAKSSMTEISNLQLD